METATIMQTMTLTPPTETPSPSATAGVLPVILIAPNVSEQMGGEAIKSFQIWQQLISQRVRTYQITHDRVKPELDAKFPNLPVTYVKDSSVQQAIWKVKALRPLMRIIFQWRAAQLARELLKTEPTAIVHYTSPVSPVLPVFRIREAPVIIGPVNGNIYFPEGFRHRESWTNWFKRVSHPVVQFTNRLIFHGKQAADVLLVAGGERTASSLRIGGCREAQIVTSADSGIPDRLRDMPRSVQQGENLKFVHNGRLADHKGTDLILRAMAQTKNPVELTIIGRGPERANLDRLTKELNLTNRVTFIEWIKEHSKVAETLQQFRAFVLPSFLEANGIVVQEAMMLGLPVIALDWGGPQLLVTPECGVLIKPESEPQVIAELAAAMDRLATDGELADRMGQAGRQRAIDEGYCWSDLIQRWIEIYRRVAAKRAAGVR
jgi:glycosyltransferase involved in cell wall biosynthesis